MAQNRPKIGLSGQNKHCQNTAERKLRPKTPQGRSGFHTFAAFGPPGTKLLPNLEWIWEYCQCFRVHCATKCESQNGSKWLKTGPKWPKVGSKWLKMAQDGFKWLKIGSNVSKRWPVSRQSLRCGQNGGQ